MNYSVDSYGNLIAEIDPSDEDEYSGEFDWYYEQDDEADETPRWIENRRVDVTNWWSEETFEPEVERSMVRELGYDESLTFYG
jgi:hypothetical protein